jgi:hypothetical protein
VSNSAIYRRQFGEIDDLLLHLKGLVLVRGLLEERGVSEVDIAEHTHEIERLRARLADLVRDTGGGALSAAA